jgi:hypothetical protein
MARFSGGLKSPRTYLVLLTRWMAQDSGRREWHAPRASIGGPRASDLMRNTFRHVFLELGDELKSRWRTWLHRGAHPFPTLTWLQQAQQRIDTASGAHAAWAVLQGEQAQGTERRQCSTTPAAEEGHCAHIVRMLQGPLCVYAVPMLVPQRIDARGWLVSSRCTAAALERRTPAAAQILGACTQAMQPIASRIIEGVADLQLLVDNQRGYHDIWTMDDTKRECKAMATLSTSTMTLHGTDSWTINAPRDR